MATERRTFEQFYYGEVRDVTKATANTVISAQFEKLRENLNLSEVKHHSPQSLSGGIGYSARPSDNSCPARLAFVPVPTDLDQSQPKLEQGPHVRRSLTYSPVPSHIVKNVLRTERPTASTPTMVSPQHYHFHGDRQISPQQMHKELYLHHDIFLNTTNDADTEQALMHHLHPHAPNHPEQEYKGAAVARPPHKKPPSVPSHVQPALPHKPTATTRPRSPSKERSPQQQRKDLHLRHDMFLTSEDDDVLALAVRRAHPHPANHPERKPAYRSPPQTRSAATSPQIRAVNPNVSFPERHDLVRTLGSSNSLKGDEQGGASTTVHTFRGVRAVSAEQLKGELHLHHDVFLRSEDEAVVQAVQSISRRRQEVVSRYPHRSDEQLDYSLKPDVKGARRTVPSHIVQPRATAASTLRARRNSEAGRRPKTVRGTRSMSPTAVRRRHSAVYITPTALASASTAEASAAADANHILLSTHVPAGNCAEKQFKEETQRVDTLPDYAGSTGRKGNGKEKSLVVNSEATGSSAADLRGPSPNTVVDRLSPTCLPTSTGTGTTPLKRGPSPLKKRFNFQSKTDSAHSLVAAPAAIASPSAAVPAAEAGRTSAKESTASSSPAGPVHYARPLTAAEHAAALALTCKLTAANLAYHREQGAPVAPQRGMSRALSQLVYNVQGSQ